MSFNAVEELAQPIPANDDFQSLEDKIYRTIEQLKTAREAKVAAERTATRLREQIEERDAQVAAMRNELVALRRDREEVRTRIEKILKQIEALTSSDSEA